jgi:hypothetical protein
MPSEKEKNRNTKSVPTFMSPIRSKKSQPKSKGSKTPSRERREQTESKERGGNFKISWITKFFTKDTHDLQVRLQLKFRIIRTLQ